MAQAVVPVSDDERRTIWDNNSSWWTTEYLARPDLDYRDVILPLLEDTLKGQQVILDIGGGEGRVSRHLIEKNGCDVVCLDFSVHQLEAAKGKDRKPSYVQASAADLPFCKGAFNAAVACLVFEHILELSQVVEEAHRVLRQGGKFVLVLNHPVIQTPDSGFIHDHVTEPPTKYWRIADYLVETTHYEEVEKGIFLPYEHRSISSYINTLIGSGFTIQRLYEPSPSDDFIAKSPEYSNIRSIPRLLFVICEK